MWTFVSAHLWVFHTCCMIISISIKCHVAEAAGGFYLKTYVSRNHWVRTNGWSWIWERGGAMAWEVWRMECGTAGGSGLADEEAIRSRMGAHRTVRRRQMLLCICGNLEVMRFSEDFLRWGNRAGLRGAGRGTSNQICPGRRAQLPSFYHPSLCRRRCQSANLWIWRLRSSSVIISSWMMSCDLWCSTPPPPPTHDCVLWISNSFLCLQVEANYSNTKQNTTFPVFSKTCGIFQNFC